MRLLYLWIKLDNGQLKIEKDESFIMHIWYHKNDIPSNMSNENVKNWFQRYIWKTYLHDLLVNKYLGHHHKITHISRSVLPIMRSAVSQLMRSVYNNWFIRYLSGWESPSNTLLWPPKWKHTVPVGRDNNRVRLMMYCDIRKLYGQKPLTNSIMYMYCSAM